MFCEEGSLPYHFIVAGLRFGFFENVHLANIYVCINICSLKIMKYCFVCDVSPHNDKIVIFIF